MSHLPEILPIKTCGVFSIKRHELVDATHHTQTMCFFNLLFSSFTLFSTQSGARANRGSP